MNYATLKWLRGRRAMHRLRRSLASTGLTAARAYVRARLAATPPVAFRCARCGHRAGRFAPGKTPRLPAPWCPRHGPLQRLTLGQLTTRAQETRTIKLPPIQ